MGPTQVFQISIDDIPFSTRVQNALRAMHIDSVLDLVRCTEPYLLHSPNIGRKSLGEIRTALADFGLTLGMVVPEPANLGQSERRSNVKSLDDWIVESAGRRIAFLERTSRDGCPGSDVHLGRLHLEGIGVTKDYRKARLFFIRAARRGNKLGYWNLSLIYRIGYGVRRSLPKADRWQRAYQRRSTVCERGYPSS